MTAKKFDPPMTHTASVTLKGSDIKSDENGCFEVGTIDFSISMPLLEEARTNGGKVLYATISICHQLDNIISDFLMGSSTAVSEEKNFLTQEILQSPALSFRFKKEIVQKIINSKELLPPKEKQALEQNLARIEKVRNALAHGKLKHDNVRGVLLSYYSGGQKTYELNEEFWSSTEELFKESNEFLKSALNKVKSHD